MKRTLLLLNIVLVLFSPELVWAADSYRYLHVSIDTPWHIFLFLLIGVLAPFVLMAVLYWKYARRTRGVDDKGERRETP